MTGPPVTTYSSSGFFNMATPSATELARKILESRPPAKLHRMVAKLLNLESTAKKTPGVAAASS